MMVKFKSDESALACMKKMDGRFYDGRSISATLSQGRDKFKRSQRFNEEEERIRHEEYGKWLENDQ